MTYYRKYRPQSLDELLGQDHIKKALEQAASSDTLHHAYLFCGPRGTGKTSTARILAKIVNCTGLNADGNPCNKCASCASIADGTSLDLIEIDGASNRQIDDIRELRDKIKLAPSTGKKKVYIIDEAHMLTTEAFNALLKTLEEPPSHVVFVLATTEAHKIPSTILSRVQRFDFTHASQEDLSKALQKIAKEEGIEAEDGVLNLVAKKSDGSFRDAEKMLEQLTAGMGAKISLKQAEEVLRSSSFADLVQLLEALAGKDAKAALDGVSKQLDNGLSPKDFILELMFMLRQMLLLKYKANGELKKELSRSDLEKITEISSKFDTNGLLKLLENLNKAVERIKFTSIPALPLEVAIIESCSISQSQPAVHMPEPPKMMVTPPKAVVMREEETAPAPEPVVTTPSEDLSKLLDKWTYVLETVKPFNYSLEALLKQAKVANCNDGIVILEVPYAFYQRILEAPKSRNFLENVFTDVLGKPVKVSCVIGARPVVADDIQNVELAADDEVIRIAAEIFNSDSV